jgi:glycosidase
MTLSGSIWSVEKMANNTDISLRNKVLYQVYPRNHGAAGTFKALEADLDRIKDLGVDMIHLLPVHPIGKKNRKGLLGSPYAISDYRAINPELGTMEDFTDLVRAMHDRGIGCVMDIVYNNTSPVSVLSQNHPEWFYHKPDTGTFGNRIGEWWDVIDLDYGDPGSGLWDYQIETLVTWAKIVDGFRCDVAPLVPLEFWRRAREEVAAINPGCIWIAESVEPSFIVENRAKSFVCHSDAEIFGVFDVCYDYDIFGSYQKYLDGSSTLASYAEKINAQEYLYPANYVKLRNLENHDRSRAAFSIQDEKALRNWTAFNYFQKGLTLIYAGQELSVRDRPNLFEKDPVEWNAAATPTDGAGPAAAATGSGRDLSGLMRTLYRIKKDPLFAASNYEVRAFAGGIMLALHRSGGRNMFGVFSMEGRAAVVPVPVPDGNYVNLIDASAFRTGDGRMSHSGEPVIFELYPNDSPRPESRGNADAPT